MTDLLKHWIDRALVAERTNQILREEISRLRGPPARFPTSPGHVLGLDPQTGDICEVKEEMQR